jgi:hypothetical protein
MAPAWPAMKITTAMARIALRPFMWEYSFL